jgi:hypothetical protein
MRERLDRREKREMVNNSEAQLLFSPFPHYSLSIDQLPD